MISCFLTFESYRVDWSLTPETLTTLSLMQINNYCSAASFWIDDMLSGLHVELAVRSSEIVKLIWSLLRDVSFMNVVITKSSFALGRLKLCIFPGHFVAASVCNSDLFFRWVANGANWFIITLHIAVKIVPLWSGSCFQWWSIVKVAADWVCSACRVVCIRIKERNTVEILLMMTTLYQ